MNPVSAISAEGLRAGLRDYFGIPQGSTSQYRQKKDFAPGILSETAPSQLHETAHHSGGSYVHLESGCPAMKGSVIAMLEAHVPIDTMRGAMDYLKANDWERWRVLHEMTTRPPLRSAQMVADSLTITASWLNRQVKMAIESIAQYLEWYYDADAKTGA